MKFVLPTTLVLLLAAAGVWFLEEIDVLTPGSSFGSGDGPSTVIFFIGAIISAVCLPMLYFSSYRNANNRKRIWTFELSTIAVAFPISVFFQFCSGIYILPPFTLLASVILLVVSHRVVSLRTRRSPAQNPGYAKALRRVLACYVIFVTVELFTNALYHVRQELRDLLWNLFGHG